MNNKTFGWLASALAFHLVAFIPSLRAQDEILFNEYLKATRDAIAKHHLIVYVHYQSQSGEPRPTEFRYDHYPEMERIQTNDGNSYIRKDEKSWVKSDDWGATGTPANPEKTKHFDGWISLINAPLNNIAEAREHTQGETKVVRVENPAGEKSDKMVFEIQREHASGMVYPKFTFTPFQDGALLHEFSGPMYFGDGKIMASIRYDVMSMVKVEQVTPTPSASPSEPPAIELQVEKPSPPEPPR